MPEKSVLVRLPAKCAGKGIPDTAQPVCAGDCFPVDEVLEDFIDTFLYQLFRNDRNG
jgi:hypothetical protein